MKETLVAGMLFISFSAVVVFLIMIAVSDHRKNEAECQRKYGKNWHYRYQQHEADLCVNEKGEAKYL